MKPQSVQDPHPWTAWHDLTKSPRPYDPFVTDTVRQDHACAPSNFRRLRSMTGLGHGSTGRGAMLALRTGLETHVVRHACRHSMQIGDDVGLVVRGQRCGVGRRQRFGCARCVARRRPLHSAGRCRSAARDRMSTWRGASSARRSTISVYVSNQPACPFLGCSTRWEDDRRGARRTELGVPGVSSARSRPAEERGTAAPLGSGLHARCLDVPAL